MKRKLWDRHIPGSVIAQVLFWLSGIPRQKHPMIQAIPKTWTAAARRGDRVRVQIGDAIRLALYSWRNNWTDQELAHAVAEVTRRVDQIRSDKKSARDHVRSGDKALLDAMRKNRKAIRAANQIQDTEIYLARQPKALPGQILVDNTWVARKNYEKQIRESMSGHSQTWHHPVYQDSRWYSSQAAADAARTDQALGIQAKNPVIPRNAGIRSISDNPKPSTRTQTVSMGELARLAADMNGRRL